MDNSPVVILVTGPPASGKTALARKISSRLDLPLVSRDDIKLLCLNELGWKDREWSKKVGRLSYQLLDYIAENHFRTGSSIVVESAFNPHYENPKFQTWQKQYGFRCVQVFCFAEPKVILGRWTARSKSSHHHHPSHTEDLQGLRDLQRGLQEKSYDALDIEPTIRLNTNDFGQVDVEAIITQIRTLSS